MLMKQPKKGRLWLNDGSCVRLRPEYRDHVWSYDFVHCRTDAGKAFRTLNIVDEYSRECLAIRVDRNLNSGNVIDVLSDLFILRGIPSSFGQIMARSSLVRPCRIGSKLLAQKQPTSNREAPGKTGTAKASMPGSGMSS